MQLSPLDVASGWYRSKEALTPFDSLTLFDCSGLFLQEGQRYRLEACTL